MIAVLREGSIALKAKLSGKRSVIDAETRQQAVLSARDFEDIDALDAKLFAESFLKSPLAISMLERGEPLKFFVPVQRSDCAKWGGVDITIAGVTKAWIVGELEKSAASRPGGGHASRRLGLLKPGDYGVHSHPHTAKLAKNGPGGA
jgi:hypothetical protein